MKSKLFRRFDLKNPKNKAFHVSIAEALKLTHEQTVKLVNVLPQIVQAQTPAEQFPVLKKFENDTAIPPVVLQRIVNFASFIIRALSNDDLENEDPELWADDLISSGILAPQLKNELLSFITLLKTECLEKIQSTELRQHAESGSLPVFATASTTVEIRGVLKKQYAWGCSIDDFEPEIDSLVPVISIAIGVDSGLVQQFTFQTTPQNLQYLIDELRAAQKSADKLLKFAGQGK